MCKNVVIFGADMSSSVQIDSKKKYILIFAKGSAQRVDDTALTVEVQYLLNFSRSNIKFCFMFALQRE